MQLRDVIGIQENVCLEITSWDSSNSFITSKYLFKPSIVSLIAADESNGNNSINIIYNYNNINTKWECITISNCKTSFYNCSNSVEEIISSNSLIIIRVIIYIPCGCK